MLNEKNTMLIYESAMARMERSNKRLWIVVIILIGALIATNTAWVIYESKYQVTETTVEAEQDGDGINIVGGGNISYGAESKDQNTNKNTENGR